MITQHKIQPKDILVIIYASAKKQEKKQINNLIDQGIDINITISDFSPVGMLAKEGNLEAVMFLIENYHASKEDAFLCAAWGNHVDLLLHLLKQEDPNNIENLENCYSIILRGFLRGDDPSRKIFDFFYNNAKMDYLLKTLDESHNQHEQELLYKKIVNKSCEYGGQITYKELKNWENSHGYKDIQSYKMYDYTLHFMQLKIAPSFNFEQSQAWLSPALHFWFLIGIKKCQSKEWSFDIFIKISSYAFNLLEENTIFLFQQHINIVPKMLRNHCINNAEKTFKQLDNKIIRNFSVFAHDFISHNINDKTIEDLDRLNDEIESAQARYVRRITF